MDVPNKVAGEWKFLGISLVLSSWNFPSNSFFFVHLTEIYTPLMQYHFKAKWKTNCLDLVQQKHKLRSWNSEDFTNLLFF